MKLTKNKILITGGASGIGLGLTERFVTEGNTVIVCGRRAGALRQVQARLPSVMTYTCDLSEPSGRQALFDWTSKEHPDLKVLVNNAGIQQWVQMTDEDFYDRAQAEIAINCQAPIHLTHLFLNLESLETIINVGSGLAFVPLTSVPVYCATKAFMRSFTLSLRHLLRQRHIEVIELIPPALNTDLGGKGLHDFAPPVSDFIESAFEQLAEGKTEITFGFTEQALRAGPPELKKAFDRLNPVKA